MEDKTIIGPIKSYEEILRTYGIDYQPAGYYWQVGRIEGTQGWILYLSVIFQQLPELLQLVIPELMEAQVPFKIVRDGEMAENLLLGSLGYQNLGNMINIYPSDETTANTLAKRLITLTNGFRGPDVPTGRQLGSIVYTRYGAFNPVIQVDAEGFVTEYILDHRGKQIPDPYSIPFALPVGISWPFVDITSAVVPSRPKLLNAAYYPLKVLKPDSKGEVIKGIYFKRFWQIRHCIIKQGRRNMLVDPHGRDIQARLKWQYELYKALHMDIPMPEVFDYFEEQGDTYLAMQFVNGISMTDYVQQLNADRCWRDLRPSKKMQMLDTIQKIVAIIQRLHAKGYIHRDINPENFLIDKKGQLFLIDLELTWHVNGKNNPPFTLGTDGHMSPEQLAVMTPTVKEDIFGLGALLLLCLSNLPASYTNKQEYREIREALQFYTGDPILSECIASCFLDDPNKRPGLETIQSVLQETREKIEKETYILAQVETQPDRVISSTIRKGIAGLGHPTLLAPNGPWVSILQSKETLIGNGQLERTLYRGWQLGVAGPLWLISKAVNAGYQMNGAKTAYMAGWTFMEQQYFSNPESLTPGLYNGRAGIAMAITEALHAKILIADPNLIAQLAKCFAESATTIDLAEGVAGQGIALLGAARWLDPAWVKMTLGTYVDIILNQQQADGGWNLLAESGKKGDILTGLDRGVAGITWFLLHHWQMYKDPRVNDAVLKSLDWFKRHTRDKPPSYFWAVSTGQRRVDPWNGSVGTAGVALVFIRAYEVFRENLYRQVAEACLSTIPPHPVHENINAHDGLVGLGEIYLEAWRIFGDSPWQERASWIAGILIHSCTPLELEGICWKSEINSLSTADLKNGSSGLIHFLMRYLLKGSILHPLSCQIIS